MVVASNSEISLNGDFEVHRLPVHGMYTTSVGEELQHIVFTGKTKKKLIHLLSTI